MDDKLIEYFEALDRLVKKRPRIMPRDIKITNDAVALEAGRGKGSIKKSRASFTKLIVAIDLAATSQSEPKNQSALILEKSKQMAKKYRCLYEEALSRELSLLFELYTTKKKLADLTGSNIFPLQINSKK